MRIVFMGTPEFTVPCLERLLLSRYQIVAVYTPPDRSAGRGHYSLSPPLKKAAERYRIPVKQVENFRGAEAVKQLAELQPDVIIVFAYGGILPQSVLATPRFGCINIHPSLLPRFRGAAPVAAAILAGDEFTGVSIMLMDQGLDTGPILSRVQIPIATQDTTGSLIAKLSLISAHLIQEVLVYWLRGELTLQPQQEAEACYSKLISKKDGEIDWSQSAANIWRRVRAFQPWPGAYTIWQGRQLKIIKVVPLSEDRVIEVGRVIDLTSKKEDSPVAFGISTGDGILGVHQVQLEGKRELSGAEFLRGQRQFLGSILPS